MATIEGFDNYLIYPDGKVFSIKRDIFMKTSPDIEGYLIVGLCKNKKNYTKRIHRLVGEAFIPNPNGKPLIDHIDRNRQNNNVKNLRWATQSENLQNQGVRITNKSTGLKNISYDEKNNRYHFQKIINGNKHQKYLKTLEEAITYKENYLST